MTSHKKKVLGFFHLVMINVIAVDSIRTLPFSAVYGFSLVFFYLLAALTFFIPTALVSAELGTGWPDRGGIYVWVREAFGHRMSLIVIWLNWIYNVIWYPTIMALIAGTFAYLINPELANNRLYMCLAVLLLFWATTLANCFGMKASGLMSTIGALIGTLLPMAIIIVLGLSWFFTGKPLQVAFSWNSFFPHQAQTDNLAFLTSVLFGLLGLEMSATHAREMRNPAKDYPKALFVSSILILGSIVLASLAIAIVVPNQKLSLATGMMQAFSIFVSAFHMPWLLPLLAIFIIIGGLGGAGAWIIGPTKGLLVASQDGSLPQPLSRINKHGVPTNILIMQAVIVSLLSLIFILLPTVNSTYWFLSVLTAQLALLVYVALFAAGLKLYYSRPRVHRDFHVPGKKAGMWIVCGVGMLCCIAVLLIGFLPPSQITIDNLFYYEAGLILGMIVCCGMPLVLFKRRQMRR